MHKNKEERKQGTEKQEHRTQGRKQGTKSSWLVGFVAVGMHIRTVINIAFWLVAAVLC